MHSDALRYPPSADSHSVGATLAVLAHAALIAALAYGVNWRRHDISTVSAELWSAVPQIAAAPAAPPPVQADPAPPPAEAVVTPPPAVAAPITPPPAAAVAPPPPGPTEADIALQRARQRAAEQAARIEQERIARAKAEAKAAADKARQDQIAREKAAAKAAEAKAEKARLDKLAQDKAQKEKLAREKAAADKVAADKAAEKAIRDKLAKDKVVQEQRDKAAAQQAAAEQKQDAERLKKQREENLARLQKSLGGNGSTPGGSNSAVDGRGPAGSSGSATQATAPSAGYEGRIRARILPNITFTNQVAGHPTAEVEVRVAIDGTIIGKRLLKSSGLAEWDQAVLRAIDKTEVLPRDVDGRVPPLMLLSFDPNRR